MTVAEAIAAKAVLERMLASGVLESGHGDKRVKFASQAELEARIRYCDNIINGTANAAPRVGFIRFRGV